MIRNMGFISNVLFISISGGIGGAQRCLLDLVLRLPENIKPIVIVPNEGTFTDQLKLHSIDYVVVSFRGWWYSKYRIKFILRLYANIVAIVKILYVIRNWNIRLVYSNTLYSPIGGVLSRILNVPHVWHIHEFLHLNYIQKFDFGLFFSMRFVNRFSDTVICPSLASKQDLSLHISEDKIHCVQNGVDSTVNLTGTHQKGSVAPLLNVFNILIIGSVIQFKGQNLAIQALSELILRGWNVKLHILGDGDGSYISELKLLAVELGVEDKIIWLGFQEDVRKYILNADLLYVCSRFETFGMVVIEAMSLGCPVIATRTGGIPEIINDGYSGFLYEVDRVAQLVEKTICLFEDRELYSDISQNSITTARLFFSVEKYADSIVNKLNLTLRT